MSSPPDRSTQAAHASPAARWPVLVRELTSADRPGLLAHFLALGAEDRVLRFGNAVQDRIVEGYVRSIDFAVDSAFGVFDEQLEIVGVGHLAYLEPAADGRRAAELGISVAASARARGIGTQLFQRAATRCSNAGVGTLYMHCLSHNATMMRIARKAGMRINHAHGEADAYLTLPSGNHATIFNEWMQEQSAVFDYEMKRRAQQSGRMMRALSPLANAA